MLVEAFKSILLTSLAGGVLSLFWLALRPVTRKVFSPHWQYYIWLTVLLVMVLPVSFHLPQETPVSVPAGQMEPVAALPQLTPEAAGVDAAEDQLLPEPSPVQYIRLPRDFMFYGSLVWLCGAAALLLWKLVRYGLFLRAVCSSAAMDITLPNLPRRLRVRRTELLDAPLLVGLFRPALYLPAIDLEEKQLQYILMHELVHYRRMDLLYKWAAMLVQCVHWFNPLVYIVLKQIDAECEVSCDFAVTRKLSGQEQNNYMDMILKLLAVSKTQPRLLTTQMASNKKNIEKEIYDDSD